MSGEPDGCCGQEQTGGHDVDEADVDDVDECAADSQRQQSDRAPQHVVEREPVAARSDVTTITIRFWEVEGLLPDPARTPSGYRRYDSDALAWLDFIRHAQTAGLTLAEIRQVLEISDTGEPPCGHVTDLTHQHLADVDLRIRHRGG